MTDNSIQCPECGAHIEISAVLSKKIEDDLKRSLQQENDTKLREALARQKAQSDADAQNAQQALQQEIAQQQKQIEAAQQAQQELEAQKHALNEAQAQFEKTLNERLQEREASLTAQLNNKIRDEHAVEITNLKTALQEKSEAMDASRAREMQLMKQARQLEEEKKSMDLEIQRQVESSRKEIEQKLNKEFDEASRLKLLEKEKQIEGLRKSLEEAKRKSEQGSMETQGEVLEVDLESKLRQAFPHDQFSPVLKGARGADVIQQVFDAGMNECGRIIWEVKNTKAFSPQWIQKLKDDQRSAGASLAVLVSVALPDQIKQFGQHEGVWISDIHCYLPLVSALRDQLIQVNFARQASEGKGEKMEMMFTYLSGDEFRQRVEAIVEAFNDMQEQLNKERRAMEKLWREREKQIQRITTNTIGMYGEVRGIIGSSVQTIPALELEDESDDFALSPPLSPNGQDKK